MRGGGEAWYKGPHAQPSRSLSISVGTALTHPPGEYSELGRGLFGRGGRDGKELLAARVQPAGPSPPTGIGRAWAGRVLWGLSAPGPVLVHSAMSSAPAQGPAPASLTLWDEEDFQGRRCRLLSDCANIGERGGLRRVRSVKVENGA